MGWETLSFIFSMLYMLAAEARDTFDDGLSKAISSVNPKCFYGD